MPRKHRGLLKWVFSWLWVEKGLHACFFLLPSATVHRCNCPSGTSGLTRRRKYLVFLQRVCFTLFSWGFQSDIKEIYRSFVTKHDRNRSRPSAGSVDIKTPEYTFTVAEDVSSSDYPWFCFRPCLALFVLIWASEELLLVTMVGSLPWGQVKAADHLGSGSRVSLSGDVGFCLLPIPADSQEWIFDSLLSQSF